MDTPFIENSSDFDASFDSAHIEKICFFIKIRALIITYHFRDCTSIPYGENYTLYGRTVLLSLILTAFINFMKIT